MRSNPFIAQCKYEDNVDKMTIYNCNLFKRSISTQGLGYTFNNERLDTLIKKDFRSTEFSPNIEKVPSLMTSASSKSSLTVVIENNFENTMMLNDLKLKSGVIHKPKQILVSLHNPKEPSDTKFKPSTSIEIPLGHSTTFLLTPKAREIDESGKELTENKRDCRLDEDTDALDIFNVYTRTGCLFECKMKYAISMCGCTPWYYYINMSRQVLSKTPTQTLN